MAQCPVGERVRNFREAKGLTQAQLALLAIDEDGKPMKREAIARIEAGNVTPTDETVARLAKALRVYPAQLSSVEVAP